jgi:hypothetical protein
MKDRGPDRRQRTRVLQRFLREQRNGFDRRARVVAIPVAGMK